MYQNKVNSSLACTRNCKQTTIPVCIFCQVGVVTGSIEYPLGMRMNGSKGMKCK